MRDEVTAVAINTAVISSLACLAHTELPPVGQIHSREACETALDNNRGLLYDLEAARCSFNLFVVVDGVPPELDAAGDIHSRGDSAGVTAAAGCNHTLFLVIDRWDDDAEVEEAGGRNQACDIAAQGLRNCTLDTEGCAQKSNWHVPKWLRMQGRTDDGAMLCRSHGSNWEQRLEALEFRRREINCHIEESKHRGWGFGCNGRPTQSSLARL